MIKRIPEPTQDAASAAAARHFEFLDASSRFRDPSTPAAECRQAAAVAFGYALEAGERLPWAQVLQGYREFVADGRPLPPAALETLAKVFDAFCLGASMDEAFGLRRKGKPRKERLAEDLWAQTDAWMVEHFHSEQGMSLEAAYAQVAQARQRKTSEATIARNYKRFRAFVKGKPRP